MQVYFSIDKACAEVLEHAEHMFFGISQSHCQHRKKPSPLYWNHCLQRLRKRDHEIFAIELALAIVHFHTIGAQKFQHLVEMDAVFDWPGCVCLPLPRDLVDFVVVCCFLLLRI